MNSIKKNFNSKPKNPPTHIENISTQPKNCHNRQSLNTETQTICTPPSRFDLGWDNNLEEEIIDVVNRMCEGKVNGGRNIIREGREMND